MLALSWEPRFETKIAPIDSDHERQLDLFNELVHAVEADAGSKAVADTLSRLIENTRKHFRREEMFLEAFGCPPEDLGELRAEHRSLLTEIEGLAESMGADGEPSLNGAALRSFRDCLSDHMLGMDKQCAAAARSHMLGLL